MNRSFSLDMNENKYSSRFYYSDGVLWKYNGMAYWANCGSFDKLLDTFLRNNPIWVQCFGRVPAGIGTFYRALGVNPNPQAWIADEDVTYLKWTMDIDRSIMVANWKLSNEIEKNVDFWAPNASLIGYLKTRI